MKNTLLLLFCAVCTVSAQPVATFQGTVNDIVTPKVVSIKVTTGTMPVSGTVLMVKRAGDEVAKLKLRTPTGICKVLSGQVKKGDVVFLAPTASDDPATAGEATKTSPVSNQAYSSYSDSRAIKDPDLRALLEAEGLLLTGNHLAALQTGKPDEALSESVAASKAILDRVRVAKSVMALTTPRERVVAELVNAGKTALAQTVSGDLANLPVSQPPILPGLARKFPLNAYGTAPLITKDLAQWKTPRFWGENPIDPNFSGWTFTDNEVALTDKADALIRHDMLLDDVEVTGQVRIESGTSLYVLLRNEVVVKFIHESADCGVALKAGYNNLRFITSKGSCKLLEKNRWYAFKITLVGDQLSVVLDGKNVLKTGVRLTRDDQVTLPNRGYLGMGTYYGTGRFKDVQVRALSPAGMSAIPVFRPVRDFVNNGDPVNVLDGKQNYACIYGTKIQSHRRVHHAVEKGTVTFSGSPFAQFTTESLAGDNYRVKGKLRVQEEGNIWLRMNEKLLFGLSATKPRDDRDDSEHAYYVKYRLGNYLSYDHGFAGSPIRPGEWYEWELEYTHPVAILRVNGRQVILARCSESDMPKPGWNHFGISAYNVGAECKEIIFQPLSPKQPALPPVADITGMFTKADALVNGFAATNLQADSGKGVAREILRGDREPVIADSKDFQSVASEFRTANNWPIYLSLLEENYRRFEEKTPTRKSAETVWRVARQKFDIAQETLEPGDLGLDNIIRLGNTPSPVAAARAKGVWYYLPGSKKLQRLTPQDRQVVHSFPFEKAVGRIADRGEYLLAFAADKKTIWKLDAQTGKELKSVTISKGQLLDWAGATGSVSFLSVDENAVNELFFSKFVIYALDETEMTLYNSGGFGQMLAIDPYGRYLYSGIVATAGGPMKRVDPSPVRPVPQGMTLDHLMCFSIADKDLSLIGDRPAPGVSGQTLAVPPSGRFVCYVAERGFRRDSDNELVGDKVAAFRAARVNRTVNSFDCGGRPTLMAFNPVQPVAYIYTGNEIRSFSTTTFQSLSTYRLPAQSVTGSGTSLSVDGTGSYVYFAYDGQPGGIAVFSAQESAGASEVFAPGKLLTKAKALITTKKGKEAETILASLAETLLFSDVGEDAATLLLTLRGTLPSDTPATTGTVYDITSIASAPLPKTLVTPDKPAVDSRRPTLKKEYKEVIEDLRSFSDLAERYPLSWHLSCLNALAKQPENLEILLLLAETSLDAGKRGAAQAYAQDLLKQSKNRGYYAIKAYGLLARIIPELAGKLHMLKQAELLDPRNPFLHKRLGAALADAGFKSHSDYHYRMSLYLFPSQRKLRDTLRVAGYSVADPSKEERAIDDLYKDLAPSAVMIRHSGGVGTGFLITRDGLLLTNHHVIGDASNSWTVHLVEGDGKKHKLPARLVASDARLDIAILSVDLGSITVEPMVLAPPEKAKTGMRTIAIGNPGMGAEVLAQTITEGIISNVSQRVGGQYYIQTSAAVNPGNSGGPLLSRHGVVIGMVTLKASLDNVGFAIPTDRLFKFLEDNLN